MYIKRSLWFAMFFHNPVQIHKSVVDHLLGTVFYGVLVNGSHLNLAYDCDRMR